MAPNTESFEYEVQIMMPAVMRGACGAARKRAPILTSSAAIVVITVLTNFAMAQDSDVAALNAKASSLDPQDYRFVQPVCTRCHTPEMFLHSRSWSGWRDIFNQMSGYGAAASQEQWDHIHRYFQRALSLIDVNHADEDELSAVLGVDEKTAIAIVQRRTDRPFQSAADLEAVPGVDRERVENISPRLLFDRLPEDQ